MMRSTAMLGLAAAALVLVAGMLFGVHAHPHFWWDGVPGFWAAFAFVAAWLLGAGAKALGSQALERAEDYYDD